jgi:hypothetical protein
MFGSGIFRAIIYCRVNSWTFEGNKLMTSLVNHEGTGHTLKSLFSESPDKFLAMRAEGWLFEESKNKSMLPDFEYILLFYCPFSDSDVSGFRDERSISSSIVVEVRIGIGRRVSSSRRT